MNSRPSEFSIIKKYFAPLAGEGSFNLADDAAQIIPSSNKSLVITQDALAEGVHFFGKDAPDLIAKKALRVNLSDLAAKGARPKYISLALGLGTTWDEAWVAQFAKGLGEDIDHFDLHLTGGDTFMTGAGFVISITAIGEVPTKSYVSRLGANTGDLIYITGTIGDGALGLLAIRDKLNFTSKTHSQELINRYLLPMPRIQAIDAVQKYATASMDISDGLVGDLEKLCKASNVSGHLRAKDIPLSEAATAIVFDDSKWLETALTGGDDYEILVCIKSKTQCDFEKMAEKLKLRVTHIGEICDGQGVKVFDTKGNLIKFGKTSYDHAGENL